MQRWALGLYGSATEIEIILYRQYFSMIFFQRIAFIKLLFKENASEKKLLFCGGYFELSFEMKIDLHYS